VPFFGLVVVGASVFPAHLQCGLSLGHWRCRQLPNADSFGFGRVSFMPRVHLLPRPRQGKRLWKNSFKDAGCSTVKRALGNAYDAYARERLLGRTSEKLFMALGVRFFPLE